MTRITSEYIEQRRRTIEDRINRLRERVKRMSQENPQSATVAGILLGVLDLLGDEL